MNKCHIDIGFVILHYIVYEDTIDCVDSIKSKIDTENYRIVIIDNDSPNNSYEILYEKFKEDKKINILRNNENLGFACGNNVGINYIFKYFSPEFVVCLNNDILLIQNDLFKKVSYEFQNYKFSVMGPMIFTSDGRCDSSPFEKKINSLHDVIKGERVEKLFYYFDKFYLYNVFDKIYKIRRKFKKLDLNKNFPVYLKHETDVILHGSFLIFSPLYFEKFNGFNESTFLYHEEEILYVLTKFKGMKMLYSPIVQVYHKEDAATDAINIKGRKKRLIKQKQCLESSKQLIKLYKELISEN